VDVRPGRVRDVMHQEPGDPARRLVHRKETAALPGESEPVVSCVLSREANLTDVGVMSICPRITPPGKAGCAR